MNMANNTENNFLKKIELYIDNVLDYFFEDKSVIVHEIVNLGYNVFLGFIAAEAAVFFVKKFNYTNTNTEIVEQQNENQSKIVIEPRNPLNRAPWRNSEGVILRRKEMELKKNKTTTKKITQDLNKNMIKNKNLVGNVFLSFLINVLNILLSHLKKVEAMPIKISMETTIKLGFLAI